MEKPTNNATDIPKTPAAKTSTVTLRCPNAVMTLTATRKPDGSAATNVTTKGADGKVERGMTEQHKTFDAAKAHLASLAEKAQKLGWKRSEFKPVTKPDAFSTLPKPDKFKSVKPEKVYGETPKAEVA